MKSTAPREVSVATALSRLEALCAKAEKCEYELLVKLRTWRISPADTEAVMDRLRQGRFVDDRRFAAAFVRDKVVFGRRGRMYLRRALAAKRIDRDIVTDAIESIDEKAYRRSLVDLLGSYIRQHADLMGTFEGRTRVFRYAVTRGYEAALVSQYLRRFIERSNGIGSENGPEE